MKDGGWFRRKVARMVQILVKMIPHLIPFTYHNLPNGYKLSKKFCHLNTRKYSFSQRMINDWNSLLADVVKAPDVDSFKSKLDLFWTQYRFVFN